MLPDDVQWYIWRMYYTNNVKPCMEHNNWWFHTVLCRANRGKYFTDNPMFINAEASSIYYTNI